MAQAHILCITQGVSEILGIKIKSEYFTSKQKKKKVHISILDTLCALCQCFIASFLRLVTSSLHRKKEVNTKTYIPGEFTPASRLSGLFLFSIMAQQPPVGQGLLSIEDS
jgi:hypothetical protein